MSQKRNQAIQYFKTDSIPTESQFAFVLNNIWFNDESFPISKITGLAEMFQGTLSTEVFESHKNDSEAHSDYLLKKDGSNINAEEIQALQEVLGVGELPDNIATVDSETALGNAYKKVLPPDNIKAYAVGVSGLPIEVSQNGFENAISEDNSLLIEPQTKNIESNVSIFSDEFETLPANIAVVSFPMVQVLGVYDSGIRLNASQYTLLAPTRIELIEPRLGEYLEIQYTHLKTDN